MLNKCFLYIDGYPRNASDVPFDLSIDWGDGSEPEQYFRLFVEKVPQFYHLYEDTEPRTIEVTITNRCGSAVQTIEYIPFIPPECDCKNFYNLNQNNIMVDFSGIEWNLEITGCFTDVTLIDAEHIAARMVTDVSTNVPLMAFPVTPTLLPDNTFENMTPLVSLQEDGEETDDDKELLFAGIYEWDYPYLYGNYGSDYYDLTEWRYLYDYQTPRDIEYINNNTGLRLRFTLHYDSATQTATLKPVTPTEAVWVDGYYYLTGSWIPNIVRSLTVPNVPTVPRQIKGVAVDFIYTFNPTHIHQVTLTGDASFRERVGEIVLANGALETEYQWASISEELFEVTVPVGRVTDTIRLSLGEGDEAVYEGMQIWISAAALIDSQQMINIETKTFLETTAITMGLPLEECTKVSGNWNYALGSWLHNSTSSTTSILKVPVSYLGEECVLELDVRWNLEVSSSSWQGYYSAEFFVSRLNDTSQSSHLARFYQSVRSTTSGTQRNVGSETVRLELNADTLNINKENFVQIVVYSYSSNRCEVELSGLRRVRENKNRITGGMSGTLLYQSEQSRNIARIDMVCDSNARARLLNEGFDWQEEDLGDLSYWRGICLLPEPEFMTEYTFEFGGKDLHGTLIGDGIIHSVQFYEVVQETEWDSPILVRLAIDVSCNVQEGIFYYTDDNGREHCVAVNEVQFTQAEFEHLHHDPATQTTLRLTTEHGTISGIVSGAVNIDCLNNFPQE
jgi:hypothetical protein